MKSERRAEEDELDIQIHGSEVDRPLGGTPFSRPAEIIVEARAWFDMNHHAASDLAREVGGMMIGEVYDHDGALAVRITDAVPAREAVNELASIRFTPEAWRQMEVERQRSGIAGKVLGWYHTHPGFSAFFSETDRFMHESFFPQPWHVALVIDPVRGEQCFFRRDGDELCRSTEFLLQVNEGPGMELPLATRLHRSLERAASHLDALEDEGRGTEAPLPATLRRLAAQLPSAASTSELEVLLPFALSCRELEREAMEEARRALNERLSDQGELRRGAFASVSSNSNPAGAISLTDGLLAQLRDSRHVHVHGVTGSRLLCETLALPRAARDLTLDDRGQGLILAKAEGVPLYLLKPPLASVTGETSELTDTPLEVDWGDREPPQPIGKILAGRGHLYLLTRQEVWDLRRSGTAASGRYSVAGVWSAEALGKASFEKLRDWTVDPLGNLFLLLGSEVMWYQPRSEAWDLLLDDPAMALPRGICAGLTALSILEEGSGMRISQYALPSGRLLARRPFDEDLAREEIWHLFCDAHQRLYLATDREVLAYP